MPSTAALAPPASAGSKNPPQLQRPVFAEWGSTLPPGSGVTHRQLHCPALGIIIIASTLSVARTHATLRFPLRHPHPHPLALAQLLFPNPR